MFYQRWPLEAFLYHRIVSCVLKKSIARPYGFKLWLISRQSLKAFAKITSVTSISVYILYITYGSALRLYNYNCTSFSNIYIFSALSLDHSCTFILGLGLLVFLTSCPVLSADHSFLLSCCPLLSSSCGLSVAHACPPCHVSEYWQNPVLSWSWVFSVLLSWIYSVSVVHSCPTFPVQVFVQSCPDSEWYLLLSTSLNSERCPFLSSSLTFERRPFLSSPLGRVLSIPVLLGWFWAFPLMFFPSCSKSWQLLSCLLVLSIVRFCPSLLGSEFCPQPFFPSWFWVSTNPVLLSWI